MKKVVLLAITIFIVRTISAQHEVQVYGMGGYSALLYKVKDVDIHSRMGYGAGVGYTYMFGSNYDVRVGAEAVFSTTNAQAPIVESSYKAVARDENSVLQDIIFNANYEKYRETQRITYLNLPVMAGWHSSMQGEINFYMQAGIKMGINLRSSYTIEADKLTTWGYVPEWWADIQNAPSHNFIAENHSSHTFKIVLGVNILAACEIGIKWQFYPQWTLYTGAYLDYGVLNVAPIGAGALVSAPLTHSSSFTYNSLLNATADGSRYVDKLRTMSIGIRVGFAWKNKE